MNDPDTLRAVLMVAVVGLTILACAAAYFYRCWREEQATTKEGSGERLAELKEAKAALLQAEKDRDGFYERNQRLVMEWEHKHGQMEDTREQLAEAGRSLAEAEARALQWCQKCREAEAGRAKALGDKEAVDCQRRNAETKLAKVEERIKRAESERDRTRHELDELVDAAKTAQEFLDSTKPKHADPLANVAEYMKPSSDEPSNNGPY